MSDTEASRDASLVPVQINRAYVPKRYNHNELTAAWYLTSATGVVISFGITQSWAEQLATAINNASDQSVVNQPKTDILYRLVVPFDCVKESEGQVFAIGADGIPKRKQNFRYRWLVSKTRNGIQKYRRYKTKKVDFPITKDVHVLATICVSKSNDGILPQFLSTISKLLVDVGIVSGKRYNRIKSYDGSRVKFVEPGNEKIDITVKEYVE